RHGRFPRRQGADAPFHVVDADGAVKALLNRPGDLVAVARPGAGGDERLLLRLRKPEEVALRLDLPAIGILPVVELAGADGPLPVLPQVGAVAAEDQPVG